MITQSMFANVLFYIMIVVCAIEWIAADREWKRVRFVTKPLSIMMIVAWFTSVGLWKGDLIWFGLGLVLSLAGDVVLLWKRLFLPGMILFFLAHVTYIIGFNIDQNFPLQGETLLVVIGVIATSSLFFYYILKGLKYDRVNSKLKIPLIAYGIVISIMVSSAILNYFRAGWNQQLEAVILSSVGAVFFFLSDMLIGLRNFTRRFQYDNFLIMFLYHLGQILIASGAIIHFSLI